MDLIVIPADIEGNRKSYENILIEQQKNQDYLLKPVNLNENLLINYNNKKIDDLQQPQANQRQLEYINSPSFSSSTIAATTPTESSPPTPPVRYQTIKTPSPSSIYQYQRQQQQKQPQYQQVTYTNMLQQPQQLQQSQVTNSKLSPLTQQKLRNLQQAVCII